MNPEHLPQAQSLIVDELKITGYLLNSQHPQGAAKAKFFLKRGFSPDQWASMAEALRQHGQTQPVTASDTTMHGKKYTVECQLTTPDGRNPCILTGWIQEGDKPPRLVTAHPNS